MVPGFYPYCAMMQVAAEDTHDNYVLCRGFDIRIARFIDYDAADLVNSPGIPVAKPYGNRQAGMYEIAQIFMALLPLQTGNPSPADVLWRVGQNPGVAATCPGHPCDLSEEVEILYTDTDPAIAINWMMLDGGGSQWYIGKVSEVGGIVAGGTGTVEQHSQTWAATGTFFEVLNPHDVALDLNLKVRWTHYPGWTDWIVEPWHYTICPT